MTKPLYIFDLDGTLALIEHRRHFIADKKNQRWDEFYRACVDDLPNKPVISLLNRLLSRSVSNYGGEVLEWPADILIFSGRSELVSFQTIFWLSKHTDIKIQRFFDETLIKTRKHGDNTPDEVLKRQWYEELSQADKDRLVCVFDDRQKVVDMWRSLGITCLQVAKGDF